MSSSQPTSAREVRDASVSDLVSGIVSDTGDLLGAHVSAVRNELAEGLRDLRDQTRATIYVTAAMITAAIMVGLALAMTMVAFGLPGWLAYWIVAALSVIVLVALQRRRSKAAHKTGPAAGDPAAALARAGHDAAWLADRASDAVT
jgi:hypothetical protein